MSKGEKAEIHIESEWAYGRKGLPDAGYAMQFYTKFYSAVNDQEVDQLIKGSVIRNMIGSARTKQKKLCKVKTVEKNPCKTKT